jgi:quinol monooxygenase YgiN
MKIIVTVTSQIKSGCMKEFLTACAELRRKVLAEDGCLGYEHARPIGWPLDSDAPTDGDKVILIEIWENEAALRKHSTVPHGKAFAEAVKDLRISVKVEAARCVFE